MFIGHRGVFNHKFIKENTRAAFDVPLRLGAGIEFDVRLTKDGVPIIHHDPHLQRVFKINKNIKDLTVAELRQLAPEIPLFSELLAEYGEKCPFLVIEAKDLYDDERNKLLAKLILQALRHHNLTSKSMIIAFAPHIIALYRCNKNPIRCALIYTFSPKRLLPYIEANSGIGLVGWYFSFPLEVVKSHQIETYGIGFLNHANIVSHHLRHNYPFIFSDRVDRILPLPNS